MSTEIDSVGYIMLEGNRLVADKTLAILENRLVGQQLLKSNKYVCVLNTTKRHCGGEK